MSQPDKQDRSMLWMGAAMVACCAVPIIFALSLGGGLGAFFGGANRSSNQTGNPASDRSTQTNPIGGAEPTVMTSQVDRQFIAMMIPHHEQAIQMADLALTRAKRPEVKQLAQTIKQDQTREIQQMRTWYKSWYSADVVVMPMPMYGQQMPQSGGMQGMRMDLTALKNAADFDQEFLRQMIFHHQMAIQMGQIDASRFTRPELRELSQSIVKTQTTEIDQMQKWKQTWYKSNP
jgi:uncharacterized protein (DUF305 family)